jgi:hypothetical protein
LDEVLRAGDLLAIDEQRVDQPAPAVLGPPDLEGVAAQPRDPLFAQDAHGDLLPDSAA